MRKILFLFTFALLLTACTQRVDDAALAKERVNYARQLVDSGKWNQAKMELDSVHTLYPKQVAVRRTAKALSDSIRCLESVRNLAFADSVNEILSQRAQQLQKEFVYSRNEKYEDTGYYIHKKLYHSGSPVTCLQASVSDDAQVSLRSYVTGKTLNHRVIALKAGDVEQSADGSLHVIGTGTDRCEITTISDDGAMTLLNFISSNTNAAIRVVASGDNETTYNLNHNTIEGLCKTYELAITMRDIKNARHQIKVANAILEKAEKSK